MLLESKSALGQHPGRWELPGGGFYRAAWTPARRAPRTGISLNYQNDSQDTASLAVDAIDSFSDAKSHENLPQQIVGAEAPRNLAQGVLREAQFLGEELPLARQRGGSFQMDARLAKCA